MALVAAIQAWNTDILTLFTHQRRKACIAELPSIIFKTLTH
jgi:hypothetical protein